MLAIVVVVLCVAAPSRAHKVNVFAYVEGDKIVVEGYFSKSAKAMNCVVQFSDAAGKVVHTGKTDDKGRYGVSIADLGQVDGDLLVTLNVGDGHKKEYRLGAAEIPKSSEPASKRSVPEPPAQVPESGRTSGTTGPETRGQDFATIEAAIEAIVKRENQKIITMLGNQQKLLLEQQESGPSLKDIVGGIGWILGILGVVAFFMSRNRSR
ncbi:MAG: hypothetical protein V1792_03345 [Pseudomonadota bacterium]